MPETRTQKIERLRRQFVLAATDVPTTDWILDCGDCDDEHQHNHKCFRPELSKHPAMILFFPATTPQQINTLSLWVDLGADFIEATVEQARVFIRRHYGVLRLSDRDRDLLAYQPKPDEEIDFEGIERDIRRTFFRERRDYFLQKLGDYEL